MNEYAPWERNCCLPETSNTFFLSFTEFLRMQTSDSHMFLLSESPTKAILLPLNLSNMSVAFNLTHHDTKETNTNHIYNEHHSGTNERTNEQST